MDAKIKVILTETEKMRSGLNEMVANTLSLYAADYATLSNEQKMQLGALVNNTKALSAMFTKTIGEE